MFSFIFGKKIVLLLSKVMSFDYPSKVVDLRIKFDNIICIRTIKRI